MTVKVKVYDGIKYNENSKKVAEVVYKNIKGLEVKEISDEEILADGFDETDENKEYAIITMSNGETATFRNSFVDIFRA